MAQYDDFLPAADKVIHADGSVTTFDGTAISPASEAGAATFAAMSPMADKVLEPDGTIAKLSDVIGGGGGGGTVASVTSAADDTLVNVDNTDAANPVVGSTAALQQAAALAGTSLQPEDVRELTAADADADMQTPSIPWEEA